LKSPPLKPTDEEIEAQAIRDREYSRREAERILTREAEERRVMEEKILAMRSNARTNFQTSLPLPGVGDNTITANSPGKEDRSGWWKAAKEKLGPSRELTRRNKSFRIQRSKIKIPKRVTRARSRRLQRRR